MKRFIQNLLPALALVAAATSAVAQDAQDPEQPFIPQDPSRFIEGRMWIGASVPEAKSNFWDDNFQNYKASPGQLTGSAFGGDSYRHFDRHNALMIPAGRSWRSANE